MAKGQGQGQKQSGGGVAITLTMDKSTPAIQDAQTMEWVTWIEIKASKGGTLMKGVTARIKKGIRLVTTVPLPDGVAVYEHRESESAEGQTIELRVSLDDGSATEEVISFTIPKPAAPTQPGTAPAQSSASTAGTQANTSTAPNNQQASQTTKCKRHCCPEQLPQGTAECPVCGWNQIKDEPPSFLWRLRRDRPEDVRMAGIVLAGAGVLFLVALIQIFGLHWWYGFILATISLGSFILLSKELKTEVIIAVVVIIAIIGGIIMLTPESWMKKGPEQNQQTAVQSPEQQLASALMYYTNLWGPPTKVVRLEGEEWVEVGHVNEGDRVHYLSPVSFREKDGSSSLLWKQRLHMTAGKGIEFYNLGGKPETLFFQKDREATSVYVWFERK